MLSFFRSYPLSSSFILTVLAATALLGRRYILHGMKRLLERLRLLHIIAPLFSYLLFTLGALRNLIREKNDSVSTKKRINIIRQFSSYAVSSGCYDELWKGFWHWNVFSNLVILSRIHKRLYSTQEAQDSLGRALKLDTPRMWDEAARMLRYSCVVYGHDMVAAVEMDCDDNDNGSGVLESTFSAHRRHTQILHQLTGVEEPDILVRNWAYGGSVDYANHSVVVDHRHRQIVFTIRGTISVSDFLICMKAYSTPFYGGEAHTGFAERAIATWEKATSSPHGDFAAVAPDYELVITGHSLGASVGMLMTIMILRERLVRRPVRCVAFGPFAPFHPVSVIQDIAPHITSFVNGDDLFPFDSIQQLRIINEALAAINRERQQFGYSDVVRLICGYKEPSDRLVQFIAELSSKLEPVEGAPFFTSPAGRVFWLRQSDSGILVSELDAGTMQERRPVVFSSKMFSDHSPVQYQAALGQLTGRRQLRSSMFASLSRRTLLKATGISQTWKEALSSTRRLQVPSKSPSNKEEEKDD